MSITFRVVGPQAQMLGPASTKVFGPEGGSIGRAAGNDWVLPDPERFVSSRHAVLQKEGPDFILTDTSTNGTFINQTDQALGFGNRQKLFDGDRLLIGDYEIHVAIEAEAVSYDGRTGDTAPTAAGDGWMPPRQPARDSAASVPDSVDPLDLFPSGPAAVPPRTAPPRNADGLSPSQGARENHSPATGDYYQPPKAMPDTSASPVPGMSEPAEHVSTNVIPDDWNKTTFDTPVAPDTHRSHQAAPPQNPGPVAPVETPQPSVPADHPPAGQTLPAADAMTGPVPSAGAVKAGGPGDLPGLRQMLQIAGMDEASARVAATPELADVIGRLLHLFVEGMMEVLKARAEIKSQFRVPLTRIRPVENNPLKFCVDVQEALYSMLVKPGEGFLSPVEAFDEAFSDIKAHQMAMMAGMRAAFDNMMQRFDPQALQEEFDHELRRSRVFQHLNKTKYWEMLGERYKQMKSDADDSFHRMFGEEFASAYEEQMQRLTDLRQRRG
jgi:type VI secretion system FHA domain protein